MMKKMRSDLKNGAPVNSTKRSVALERVRELASPCSASHEDSCFKENINIKSDTPKLAMEPLQMKKKKKGGGYNLRKSLAWDRAFFTEEGVLDPLELSLISGASCGEGLPFISEDTPAKNNPLEGLLDEDLGRDRRKNFLSSNSDSSSSEPVISTSPSSHKVSARAGSKSRSRCGDCPRPLPTSSYPSHVNVSKAAAKNLKLLKVPGSKAVLNPLCTTTNSNILTDKRLKEPANASKAASRELKLPKIPVSKAVRSPVCPAESTILRANIVKHNQIAQPDFNTHKNAGLKSSSESPRTTQNASKASSLVSAHHSARNSGNTSLKRYSSVNASSGMVDKAKNSGPRMISDNMTPARVHSSEIEDKLTTFAAPCSESAFVSGRTMQPSQNQSVKPSGLRMPSPSLSFFGQPKASVLYKLSSRTTHTDVCGSQRPGSLISRDNSRRTPKVDNIPESTSSCGRAVGSNSGCLAPCHVNVVSHDIIKSNSEVNSLQVGMTEVYDAFNSDPIDNKFFKGSSYVFDGHDQDLSKKSKNRRTSREEAELQKIDNEVPSQSVNCEQLMDDKSCPVKIELPGSGWRNPELISEQSYALHESETRISIIEPRKEQNTCNLLILNQGAIKGTQCEDVFDDRRQGSLELQSDMEEMCKPDFCESGREETDQLIYSPREMDKRTHQDENALKTDDGAGEQLGVSQQSGTWSSGIGAAEALEHRRVKAKSSYLESKHQNADLLKEAIFMDVMTDKLLAGEAHTQDAVRASIIGSCKNNINLISELGYGTKQPGKDLEVQSVCRKGEVELLGKVEFNTSDKLLPNNQICIRKSQEEENIEKPLFVLPDRKAGNRLIDTKMARTESFAEMHDCNIDKDKMMKQPLVSTEFYSSDCHLSSKSHNNLINTTFSNDGIDRGKANCDASSSETMMSMVAVDERWQDDNNLISNEPIIGPANENLSISLYQDTQTMEIDYCSSFPESRLHKVSQKNILGKLTDTGPMLEDGCGNNLLASTMPLKEGGSNMDNLRNIGDSGTVLVHSPENNMLNKCCFRQPEYLAYPDDIVSEDIVHTTDGLHFENYLRTESSASEESYTDNALGSMEDSVTGKNEIHVGSLTDSSISAHDSPLNCNDAYGTDGLSCIVDTTRDPSRVEPFPETTKSEVSEDANSSVSELHTELNKDNVEVALAQNNKDDDGLNENSRTLVIPKNAVPFSDEWLAAIEAAGEDILTKKSGAVQNSPTEKSLPEPSPWSPVKKKNNQIGPFDCTKFTNILPSDSN
ncbi:hypothetical protein BUALT_Bualt13G0081900 [Buddleja alternifolia]|uniref:Uncharacterized protein n=1 Tax=Buddleja alternifolia TaxID=168488 RepID=A0AAV6WJV2_9LAMI|nr:hypothetical protein BUALT_Bualt13G0081900 [Buddleja alternifolia]